MSFRKLEDITHVMGSAFPWYANQTKTVQKKKREKREKKIKHQPVYHVNINPKQNLNKLNTQYIKRITYVNQEVFVAEIQELFSIWKSKKILTY